MDEKDLQLARALVGLDINDKPKSVVGNMQDKQQLFSKSELTVEHAEPRSNGNVKVDTEGEDDEDLHLREKFPPLPPRSCYPVIHRETKPPFGRSLQLSYYS
ncbi:hypothetical protein G9C98_001115 [Cotesia typhae]|uniref:Uncharacterized protein n=1 Tax=Cotesia typhae TaxID=2053667 RepID=A0A8J5UQ91_9HYME|nr:hypothetical protein G9C98_001115 [Cotesia typhae]